MNALNEAAKVESQQYYKTAQKNLTNIQNILRPFLTGAQDFTVEDLDNISKLLNDQSIQNVLGKNDKKALKAIQNANAMIKTKKAALTQAQQPEKTNPPVEEKQEVTDDTNKTQDVPKQETESDVGTEENSNSPAGGVGDPSKIIDASKNTLKDQINRIISAQKGVVSIDDIIAFVQSLKQ